MIRLNRKIGRIEVEMSCQGSKGVDMCVRRKEDDRGRGRKLVIYLMEEVLITFFQQK